jgi:hypothetical protein
MSASNGEARVRSIVDFVTAFTALGVVSGTSSRSVLGSRGVEMGSETSSNLSIEDRRQIAGGPVLYRR